MRSSRASPVGAHPTTTWRSARTASSPGTDFSFGLKAGTLSTAPVDLVVLKADGADRVTIRRSVTLTGDDVDAANTLIALASRRP